MNVSVVIPAHNRVDLLERAIKSVLQQTVPAEIVVVDDASNPPLANQLCSSSLDNIRLLRNKVISNAAYSRNKGVEESEGKYVAFLDSDDEWAPDHLERALMNLNDNVLHITPLKDMQKGEIWIENPVTHLFDEGGDFRSSGLVCKREVFNKIGGFNPLLNKHQDWDFVLRAAHSECCLRLGEKNTIKLDIAARERMSSVPNIEASRYFFDKHHVAMSHSHKAAFIGSVMRTSVMVSDRTSLDYCKAWVLEEDVFANMGLFDKLCWYLPKFGGGLLLCRQFLRTIF